MIGTIYPSKNTALDIIPSAKKNNQNSHIIKEHLNSLSKFCDLNYLNNLTKFERKISK